MIIKGTMYEHEFSFSQDNVNHFAEITGDNNPLHLDTAYAEKTIFKRRIIHGFLAGSIFSKVFGTLFPGEGTIYLKQSMSFKAPMYTGENYLATFEIVGKDEDRKSATVETKVIDESGRITLIGEALIQNSEKL